MNCNLADRRIDGGYGWIVVVSSFCVIVITDGIQFSFGNLLTELVEQFNETRASTAVIIAMMFGTAHLIGPFSGALCDKFGCRTVAMVGAMLSCVGFIMSTFATSILYLIITYGIVGGAGIGCMYLSANVIVVQYFEKRRGLACGITSSGAGLGMFVFNLFTRFLINIYGWRGTCLIQAGLCMQAVVFGLLLLPPLQMKRTDVKPYNQNELINMTANENGYKEQELKNNDTFECANDMPLKGSLEIKAESEHGKRKGERRISQAENCFIRVLKSSFDLTLLANSRFWIFLLSAFAVYFAYSVIISMSVDCAVQSGMTKIEASWVVSSIGIMSTVSRVILGWVADRKNVSRIVMVCVVLFLAGLSTVLSFLSKSFATTIIYSSLFGTFTGGYIALGPPLLGDLFSAALIAKSFGLYLLSGGIASITAPPLGGLLYDITGNYDVTFIVAGSMLIVAGLLVILLRFKHV